MKKKVNFGLIIVLLFAIIGVGWYFFKNYKKVPENHKIVHQLTLDSLRAYIAIADSLEIIASLPPDTIVVDTVIYDTLKIVEKVPVGTPVGADTIYYRDTIFVEQEINASIDFLVKGSLISPIKWSYKPIVKETTITIEKPAPYPVIETIEKEVPVYYNANYLSLAAGGNDKLFIFGIDYDYVTGKNVYGLQYRRFGEHNIYGIKAGLNLNDLFDRKK